MGPAVTHPWCLQFIIKVSARSYLHAMCTCGTVLHLHLTCGTRQTHLHLTCGTRRFACHLTLAIHHKSLHSVLLHPTCGTQWLTCHVYLWDLSPSPSNLWDLAVCVSLVPCVPSGFNFLKKGLIPRSQTRDLDQGLERLYHCARHLAVLASLWSCYSVMFAMWMPYRLT